MAGAGPLASIKAGWRALSAATARYTANADPLAAAANSGAFLVWGSQPFYPIYVWLLVGRDAWPALLTWLSTPFFAAVPLLARKSSRAGRALFVIAGLANTLLSAKAFGRDTQVAWFLVPCLVIAIGFFRQREWRVAAALTSISLAAVASVPYLGAPLHQYAAAQAKALGRLNLWSVVVLTLYLVYLVVRARKRSAGEAELRKPPA